MVANVYATAHLHGQTHGGIAQDAGQALYDAESGQLRSGSFMDYAMPRAADLPFFATASAKSRPPLTHWDFAVAAKVALPRRSASSSMPSSTRWAISALPIWRCRSRPSACGVPPAGKSSACAAARCSNPPCKYIRVLLSSLCAEGVTHSVKKSTKIRSIFHLEHFSFSRFSLPHGDEQTYCCGNPGAR